MKQFLLLLILCLAGHGHASTVNWDGSALRFSLKKLYPKRRIEIRLNSIDAKTYTATPRDNVSLIKLPSAPQRVFWRYGKGPFKRFNVRDNDHLELGSTFEVNRSQIDSSILNTEANLSGLNNFLNGQKCPESLEDIYCFRFTLQHFTGRDGSDRLSRYQLQLEAGRKFNTTSAFVHELSIGYRLAILNFELTENTKAEYVSHFLTLSHEVVTKLRTNLDLGFKSKLLLSAESSIYPGFEVASSLKFPLGAATSVNLIGSFSSFTTDAKEVDSGTSVSIKSQSYMSGVALRRDF